MNELTAKVSEATALQNPTPTELALLKRLEAGAGHCHQRRHSGAGCGAVRILPGNGLREAGCRCHPQGHPADDGRAGCARAAAVSV